MSDMSTTNNKIVNVYINRSNAVAESKTGVLVAILHPQKFLVNIWFDKKFIKKSEYTLSLNIGIIPDWDYKTSQNQQYKGSDIITWIENVKNVTK